MSTNRPCGTVTFDNRGRVAVVTGATGGIGRAICELFAKSGATVVGLDVADQAPADYPKDIHYQKCDVTNECMVEETIDGIVTRFGGVDILVNNAAIQPVASFVPLDQLSLEMWKAVMEVNVTGYTIMAKAVVRHMKNQKSGVIVNLASAQAHRTAREVPAYGPSKAANLMQAKQWAVEFARYGIRCVSISPGAIDTPLVRASLEKQGGEAQLANRHPLGRLGKPNEIASAVVWVSSAGASFVTATDLSVDGGLDGFAAFADPYPLPEQ